MASQISGVERLKNEVTPLVEDILLTHVRIDPYTGGRYLFDTGLNSASGFAVHAMVASFLARGKLPTAGKQLVREITFAGVNQLREDGSATQPYNSRGGVHSLVDVVEFCSTAKNLAFIGAKLNSGQLLRKVAQGGMSLLGSKADEVPGGIYKNEKTRLQNVLNASAYATNAWIHCWKITGNEAFMEAAIESARLVMDRFGAQHRSWWNYAEKWNGETLLGPSVAYQATIIALIEEVIGCMPDGLRNDWKSVREPAVVALVEGLESSNYERYESAPWARNWGNVSEIDWALASEVTEPGAAECLNDRAIQLASGLVSSSWDWLGIQKSRARAPERTPTTTVLRKAANLSGSLFRLYHPEQLSL